MIDGESGFGELLRQLRKQALLTQDELAGRARLGTRTIQDLERGVNRLTRPATARRLAEGLGLTGPAREKFLRAASGLIPAGPVMAAQAAGPGLRHGLPPDMIAFTGREEELSQLTAAVTGAAAAGGVAAVSVIGGMPGVGKTTLAVHAAHRLREEFPDRQLFIDLHGHTPGREPLRPEDALAALLAAVGVEPRSLPDDLDGRAAMWRDKMAGQRALLVLDNAASTSQAAPLLPAQEGCLVLVTSRRHLGDLPSAVTPVLLDSLPPGQAREMFTRLAGRRAVDSPAEVAELVELAGFLPLAISLLARVLARHPSWSLADLATETRESLLTLTAEQDSVAAAFEVSYLHLDPAQQRLFCLLSLHPGVTTDAYAAAALAGISQAEAAGMLEELHGEGLLTETGYRRYGMHDLLRRYARDHAAALDDCDRALERLLDYYQHTAARADTRLGRRSRPGAQPASPAEPPAGPDFADEGQALAWARADRASLLACLDRATATGQHARIVGLTAALAGLLRHDGPWADAIARHRTALRSARHLGDRLGQANTLNNLAIIWRLTGDYPAAAEAVEQSLSIYRDLGNRLGQANSLNSLAIVRQMTGDYPAAVQNLEQALSIYRDLGDRLGQANTLNDLGIVRQQAGDYPPSAQDLQESLNLYRDLGDRHGQSSVLLNLGILQQLTGDYLAATQVTQEALNICRDLGDRHGQAVSLNSLGNVWRLTGDYPAAAGALQQALSLYRDLGDRHGQGAALLSLGAVWRLTGDYPAAAGALQQSLSIHRDFGIRSSEAEVLNELGTLRRVSGELTSAGECHRQALHLARAVSSPHDEAHALAGLGRCALAGGDATQAGALLRNALEIFQRMGDAEAPGLLAELDALAGATGGIPA